jgi:putative membrane protein
MLHLSLGVAWVSLPATLGFALLLALAFTAFHYLLTVAFGRVGLVVSLLLLAIQLTSTGGLYPLQLLAAPFQAISPLLPLTYGVSGMQGIIAGGDPAKVIIAAIALAAFGVASVLVSTLVMHRARRFSGSGLTPTPSAGRSGPLPARGPVRPSPAS